MFILWRKYQLKNGQFSLRAEVVKSYRHKISGEPRNRLVCYLGSIKEQAIDTAIARNFFWLQVNVKLTKLRLSITEKENLRRQINKRVPDSSKIWFTRNQDKLTQR